MADDTDLGDMHPVTREIYDHVAATPNIGLLGLALRLSPQSMTSLQISASQTPSSAAFIGSDDPAATVDLSKLAPPEVPPAPPGVSLDANIRRAKSMAESDQKRYPKPNGGPDSDITETGNWLGDRVNAYGEMLNLFPDGHEMDYKTRPGGTRDFGNFNYATFGTARGLSRYELHSGAGVQQIRSWNWSPSYGVPFLIPPFGDNKDDYDMIDRGIDWYKKNRK